MINVVIIGDVMLDHYILGQCTRISPEAPVPVVNAKEDEWRLGGAANVANNLAALETNCTLIGICGDDIYANRLDLLLKANNRITNKLLKTAYRPTTVKSRIMVGAHQMLRIDRERTSFLSDTEENAILNTFYEEVEAADAVLISDYSKGLLSKNVLEKVFEASAVFGKTTILDPKSPDFSIYKGTSIIKPNKKEAEQATGIEISDHPSLEKASRRIKEITGAVSVITTLSEKGVGVFTNNQLQIIPTKAQKVFDVTGAGDTYLAAFAYEFARTNNVFDACEFANLAAAVVVAKIGSATATLEEISQMKMEVNAFE